MVASKLEMCICIKDWLNVEDRNHGRLSDLEIENSLEDDCRTKSYAEDHLFYSLHVFYITHFFICNLLRTHNIQISNTENKLRVILRIISPLFGLCIISKKIYGVKLYSL